MSGWVTKLGENVKNWKRRFLVLFQDRTLAYYGSDKDTKSKVSGCCCGCSFSLYIYTYTHTYTHTHALSLRVGYLFLYFISLQAVCFVSLLIFPELFSFPPNFFFFFFKINRAKSKSTSEPNLLKMRTAKLIGPRPTKRLAYHFFLNTYAHT